MHIEPGMMTGAKALLGYVTAAGSLAVIGQLARQSCSAATPLTAMIARSGITTLVVLFLFQALPHPPVGVSEVHLILGSTLFLLFGTVPAAIGLAAGLLLQGLLFAPEDLPQYGMNVTTLLVPLLGIHQLARTLIKAGTAYQDVTYRQALALSVSYQGGIVAWVAFWSFYGEGWSVVSSVATFGVAYMSVVLLEPLVDLAALALAKRLSGLATAGLVQPRVYASA